MLLNSDVVLKNESFKLGLNHFKKNNKLFAVSFAQKERNGSIVGKNKIFWANGFIQHSAVANQTQGINAWAEGGACMIDKQKFNYLGGFDEIYSPFYWEDIDLSYRAWKSGYEILFDSEILVEHFHESTIGAYFPSKQIKTIAYRNQIIFIWKNITDSGLFWKSLIFIKVNILLGLFKGDTLLLKGYFAALFRLPKIIKTRAKQKKLFILSDRDIIKKLNE
jgi:GT2 family glycosyltransferase